MRRPSARFAGVAGSAVAATLALPLTACGLTDVSLSSAPSQAAPESSATFAVSPKIGDTAVLPGTPIVVTATSGRLTDVTVLSPSGPLTGTLSPDNRRWVAQGASQGYGAEYTVQVKAVDREGRAVSDRKQFRTIVPDKTAGVIHADPNSGSTFGVGLPITLTFSDPVENREEVERHLVVATPKPIVGAWRWLSDQQVEYRPQTYWPGDIPVEVRANLVGVQMAPGVWGDKNQTFRFRTYDSIVGRVDMDEHTLTVRRNGKVIRTIPITTGKSGFETRSGIKVVMTKERTRLMDAATGGTDPTNPEYYRLTVEYAMRLTWSGEFLHAAPWSEGSQGYANVSHGCTGMSTENAAWLYSISNIGDVYEYVGNDRMMTDDGNGITLWNVAWDDWLADSKAGAIRTTKL